MPRSPEGPADIKALLKIPFSFENQAWITRTLNMTFLMAFQVNDFIVKRTMRKEFLHAAKTGRPTLNPRRDVACAAQDLTSVLARLLKSDSFLVRQLISNIRDRLVWVNALGDMQHLLDALVLIHQGEPPNSAEAALAFMGRFDFLFDDPSNFDLTVLAFDFHPHEPFAAELPYKGALLLWEVSKAAAIHALLFLYCAWVPKFDNTLVDMLAVLVLYVLLETVLRSRRSWVELWDYSTDYPDSRDVREAEDALVRLQLHARHLVLGWQMLQYVGRSMMVLTSPETLRPALPGQMRSDVMDETGAHVDCIGCELDAALSNLPAVDADAIRTLSEERYPIMREGRDNARE
ncbi:hypothetical protein BD626DRAFT_203703 [Schizophyllum amplum]|uniref:Uncharacterized protein n=1 Tax=Schizophyllum amplum TaxID=97359 RepID=A0A550BZL9_9AGAR|nr:hypothetical protein BD626DRAFT_203703 [Auriculariopsis ampla]